MGLSKSSTYFTAFFTFFIPVSLFELGIPFLRPDPHVLEVGARNIYREQSLRTFGKIAWSTGSNRNPTHVLIAQ